MPQEGKVERSPIFRAIPSLIRSKISPLNSAKCCSLAWGRFYFTPDYSLLNYWPGLSRNFLKSYFWEY